MEPAPLLAGLGKHVPQRGPEPQRAVAHRQYRGRHPAAPAVSQQTGPGLGGLPVPVGQRDEFLAASARTPATMLAAGQDSKMAAGQLGHTGTVVAHVLRRADP